MPKPVQSNSLPTIISSTQQLVLPFVSSKSRTANSELLPPSTSSRRPEPLLPTQQHDEHVPHADLPLLDEDLRGIGVSLNIETEMRSSQIYLRSAGYWKPVDGSTTDCELTIKLEVHVSAGKDHGRFKFVELKVKFSDISDKGEQYYIDPQSYEENDHSKQGLGYEPRGPLVADETHGTSGGGRTGGGGLSVNAPFFSATGNYAQDSKITHDYTNRALCTGFIKEGSLVGWTITENKARAEGVFWYFTQWPNPTITVKVPKVGLRKVTMGYQIVCEFEQKDRPFWSFTKPKRLHQSPEHGFKWISFNLEPSKLKSDNEGTSLGQGERRAGEWIPGGTGTK